MAETIDPAARRGFRRRHLTWLVIAGVVALGVLGLLAWRARRARPEYVTAAVTRGDVQRSVSATGALNPVVTVQVGTYVSGTVKTLRCDYNSEVVVGQVCATIDPLPFQLVVAEDRAQVSTAEAQLQKDRAAQLYAKTAFERDAKLLGQGTVSQETVDGDKSAYDQATAQLGLDQATVADRRAALKAAEVNLAYTDIKSPVVGTVITRSIDVGQTVAASLQTPTLFIIGKNLAKMQVDTNVSEADIGAVRVGQDAFFGVQAFPGRTFRGKVVQIRHGPITVQNIVTYDVVVAFDNPQRLLFPGMTADTHVVVDEHDGVLRVPLPAVRFNPEGAARRQQGAGATREASAEPAADRAGNGDAATEPSAGSAMGSETGTTGTEMGSAEPGEGRRRAHGGPRGEGWGGFRGAGRSGAHGGGWNGGRGGGPGGGGTGAGAGGERRAQGGRGPGRSATHRARVWVLEEGSRLRPVEVTTGLDDGNLIEVSGGGLRAGDRVVVNEVGREEQRPQGARTFGQGPGLGPGAGAGQGAFRGGGPRL